MRKFIEYLSYVTITVFILVITTSQVKAPSTKPPKITDSTLILSVRDIQNFNVILKQSASFEQYTKLSPENTLSELINWKVKQLQADTTKKK